MSIVEYGSIAPRATDVSVGLVATPSVVVAVVLEDGLQLVLLHARPDLAHHYLVSCC